MNHTSDLKDFQLVPTRNRASRIRIAPGFLLKLSFCILLATITFRRRCGKQSGVGPKKTFKNGKREGLSVWYYDNGRLYIKGTWKDGKLDGPHISYKKDGTVDKENTGTYKDGKKISD